MRKITKEAVNIFMNGGNVFKKDNTRVECSSHTHYMYLYNNLIAVNDILSSGMKVSLAGWNTKVTRERLNGIPGVSIHTCKGQAYLNGNPIENDKFYTI